MLSAHPPPSCRTSPPLGGRSFRGEVSHLSTVENEVRKVRLADLPLEGEMSGRTEGGEPGAPESQ
ncbi:MAG: hypothetical protein DI546_12435 [Rhizobium sp.]|nr:MAG: hypothetical protein DI546_12435 [Rhizobium sp.]